MCGAAREEDRVGQALAITAADTGQAELRVPSGALSPRNPTHNHCRVGRTEHMPSAQWARSALLG